jgi:hypothetical protein
MIWRTHSGIHGVLWKSEVIQTWLPQQGVQGHRGQVRHSRKQTRFFCKQKHQPERDPYPALCSRWSQKLKNRSYRLPERWIHKRETQNTSTANLSLTFTIMMQPPAIVRASPNLLRWYIRGMRRPESSTKARIAPVRARAFMLHCIAMRRQNAA